MCTKLFKRLLYVGNSTMYLKNRSTVVRIPMFGKRILTSSGKSKLTRDLFFFHNKLNVSNLFLTKKVKPRPILKKK